MRIRNPFKELTKFERILWISSLVVILCSYLISSEKSWINCIASLVGVTALIFVAKGDVFGQILTVIFSMFYGYISFEYRYYGELITYVFMTGPTAIMSIVSWIRHPYKDTHQVEVQYISKRQWILLAVMTVIVTFIFYFILKYFNTVNLIISTISIATTFSAAYLTFLRSPYYALAYSANDIVLICLWILASISDISYLPMIFCFVMFLFNDLYGFYNWGRMGKNQNQ